MKSLLNKLGLTTENKEVELVEDIDQVKPDNLRTEETRYKQVKPQ